MRNFRELEVWKDARKLVKEVYLITKLLPKTETYGLTQQIQRSAVSIPANIAEGCGKNSNRDFARFLQISLGSIYELETHLILCNDLGFIPSKEFKTLVKAIQLLQKRLTALIKYNTT
ncbi:four helix bundle protein [Flagellimonas algicola]|uniref:Four helix bundle protein n=1 Tax=Flagellimonas algicola TaxID=2583815 RepID=A0ABY2WHC7_9FLAO|nr:four helix bundle protein [Allomuricauda algicola]TMU50987.1 four helix bundle protein [Allomuricauda algicola]